MRPSNRVSNTISILRVLALPFILMLLASGEEMAARWALLVLLLAIVSDLLDGQRAHTKSTLSRIGSFLDPLADKLLIAGLLLFFVLKEEYSVLILTIFILRDIAAGVFRFLAGNEDVRLKGKRAYAIILTNAQYGIIIGLVLARFHSQLAEPLILGTTLLALFFAFISIIHFATSYSRGLYDSVKRGRLIEKEDMVVLANKRSRGYLNRYRRRLLKIFARRRNAPILYLPNKEDAFRGIEKHTRNKEHVVIAGGDGTFEGALNHHSLQRRSLGFFPLGAGNAFYSYFYRGKRFEYLRSRFPFKEIKMDVLELVWESGKQQTLFMNIGIDADVIRLSETRTKHGFFDYVVGSWRAILTARRGYDFSCTIDGRKNLIKNCVTITLAKIPYLGFAIRSIPGLVKPNDRQVYGTAVVNSHSPFFNKAVRLWGLLIGMFNLDRAPLLRLKGRQIEIRSEVPFPLQAGGEFLGFTKWVKVRVVREQKVLVV